jgi:heme-degrading monooxygenase HmoA
MVRSRRASNIYHRASVDTDNTAAQPTQLPKMILEVAILDVKPGRAQQFESAFADAQSIVMSMPGYVSHRLQKCIEDADRYVLLIEWETLLDHTEGFRNSESYQRWKDLLHHFYDPFPVVQHYDVVAHCSSE